MVRQKHLPLEREAMAIEDTRSSLTREYEYLLKM
jgi:hypothetical protein